jgi:RsiW-degrading membrane proteinase PrsW (M82 family)
MNQLLILGSALLPAILLLLFIYHKDSKPEPKKLLLKAFFIGVLITIPIILLELGISYILFGSTDVVTGSFVTALISAFAVAALPEEVFKLLGLRWVTKNNPFFDEHFDGIVYAVFVSLGFASVENVLYLFGEYDEWVSVAIARGLLSVPGHYAFGILMGYFYSMYIFVERSTFNGVMALAAPILAHGIYDTIAFSSGLSAEWGGALTLLLIVFCVRMHKFCKSKLDEHLLRDKDFANFGLQNHEEEL